MTRGQCDSLCLHWLGLPPELLAGFAGALTRPFHLDRASLFCRCARLGEQGALGTPPGGILLRDPSAAEQDNVTIAFYQLQMGRDSHVLSAAD